MSETTLNETKLPNRIYRAVVMRTERLTEGMMRIVLGGPDLATFISTGIGDEYIRLFLPERGETIPVYPHPEGDYWEYTADQVAGPMRTYTIRSVDPQAGEISVDFVVHPGGIAADWALSVETGSEVGFNTPTGLYELPADATWQVLLADATGLPPRRVCWRTSRPASPPPPSLRSLARTTNRRWNSGTKQGCVGSTEATDIHPAASLRCCARWTCRKARATSGLPARPG